MQVSSREVQRRPLIAFSCRVFICLYNKITNRPAGQGYQALKFKVTTVLLNACCVTIVYRTCPSILWYADDEHTAPVIPAIQTEKKGTPEPECKRRLMVVEAWLQVPSFLILDACVVHLSDVFVHALT